MGMGLQPTVIMDFDAGLVTNKKPVFIPEKAFSTLNNAYVYRGRVLKKQGNQILGRLQRNFTSVTLSTQASGTSYSVPDLLSDPSINVRNTGGGALPEPNAQIAPGTVTITVGGVSFTDTLIVSGVPTSTAILYGTPSSNFGTINYNTGALSLTFSPAIGATNVVISFGYYPAIPVMGIWQEIMQGNVIDNDLTIWFDQKYAYFYNSTDQMFQELVPGTTWNGSDSDFFYCYNAFGITPNQTLFFATNFVSSATNPIRYLNGGAWTSFSPAVDNSGNLLLQARILVSYYGRMIALNVYEGAAYPGTNYPNRCRFSALGNPLAVNAWNSAIFGQGGFIDAPTNEAIISALFIKNTLIVTFETTTWQLRYVGEYGLPFIWERVSVDFGSDSTFSTVVFENHMLCVGDKGIVAANAVSVNRIDLDIPDQVFQFFADNNGSKRVWGVRDYQRELVFWNYPDSTTQAADGVSLIYPNMVLLYNYRNNTWALFRDSVTAFGTFFATNAVTWDSNTVTWDDEDITWDDADNQTHFPFVVAGNQQGFCFQYGYTTSFSMANQASLQITAVTLTPSGNRNFIQITSPNHNLQPLEIIYIQSMNWLDINGSLPPVALTSNLNNGFFQVAQVVDVNNIMLAQWDFAVTNPAYQTTIAVSFTPTPLGTATYEGAGVISLIPVLDVQTKDFNIYQAKSLQTKLSFIDFLMTPTNGAAMTVNCIVNTSYSIQNNIQISQLDVSTNLNMGFYMPGSDMALFRWFGPSTGYLYRIQITYDNFLMNTLSTHANTWELHGIKTWTRPGARTVW